MLEAETRRKGESISAGTWRKDIDLPDKLLARYMAVDLHKYYFRYIVRIFGQYICIFCVPRD